MAFLVIVLFALTVFYSRLQYKKLGEMYNSLQYDIVELQNKIDFAEADDNVEVIDEQS